MILFRLIFILVLIGILSSCTYNLNFNPKTDRNLQKTHRYSEKSENLSIFYNVIKKSNVKEVRIALKNKSRFFMSSFSIKHSVSGESRFISVGNIKNNNSREIVINVPSDSEQLNLTFEYFLTKEDNFMRRESYGGAGDQFFIKNEEFKKVEKKILYLK